MALLRASVLKALKPLMESAPEKKELYRMALEKIPEPILNKLLEVRTISTLSNEIPEFKSKLTHIAYEHLLKHPEVKASYAHYLGSPVGSIVLKQKSSPHALMHEIGHAIEMSLPPSARQFLKIEGEKLVKSGKIPIYERLLGVGLEHNPGSELFAEVVSRKVLKEDIDTLKQLPHAIRKFAYKVLEKQYGLKALPFIGAAGILAIQDEAEAAPLIPRPLTDVVKRHIKLENISSAAKDLIGKKLLGKTVKGVYKSKEPWRYIIFDDDTYVSVNKKDIWRLMGELGRQKYGKAFEEGMPITERMRKEAKIALEDIMKSKTTKKEIIEELKKRLREMMAWGSFDRELQSREYIPKASFIKEWEKKWRETADKFALSQEPMVEVEVGYGKQRRFVIMKKYAELLEQFSKELDRLEGNKKPRFRIIRELKPGGQK